MRIVEFSIRRPVTVVVLFIAIVVFGVVGFDRLSVDLLPDITYPSLNVRTDYEGAAPSEIENLITRPIENAVGVVNNVVRVVSSSRPDLSEVTLEFGWGTDMDMAALDVRERLDVVRLPLDAPRPTLLRFDPSLDPILRFGLTGDEDLVRLRLIAEQEIQRNLERVEGVAAVLVSGGLEEEIHVEIDERKVANLGLSVPAVVNRLGQENVNLTAGRLLDGGTEYLVRTINEFERPEDMRNIVVDAERTVIRLDDVATIRRGAKEREVITRIDGRESIEIAVYKEGGTNTVTVADEVLVRVGELEERLDQVGEDLALTLVTDQARYIRQSVSEVLQTAVMGGVLAIFVLILFLGELRSTLIIGVSIPISVIGTFFLMYVSGVSLNIMSLGGITLGIGLLVDNSIVVLEAIKRKRQEGLGLVEASRAGTGEVGQAVVASTMTTVCVFVPIVFVEGIAGQLFGDQALTVTFSLAVSLLVALTLIPMLASREFRPVAASEQASFRTKAGRLFGKAVSAVSQGVLFVAFGVLRGVDMVVKGILWLPSRLFRLVYDGIVRAYPPVLNGALNHPFRVGTLAVALFAGAVYTIPSLGTELVPELIQGEFYVDTELPAGTHLDLNSRRIARLEETAAEIAGVRTVYATVGTSSQQGGAAGELRENIGQLTVVLDPPVDRVREDAAMAELRPHLEGDEDLLYIFGRPSYFSFRTPVELEIRGFNLTMLERTADEAVAGLREIPGLVDVKSSTEGGNPELQVRFHRDRVAALGYNVNQLGTLIRSKVLGDVATDIQREDRSIDIRLRTDESFRDSVADLRNLNISDGGAATIPLSSVADVDEVTGPAEIRRADGERVATITANIVGRDLGSVATDIEALMAGISMPASFSWRLGGQQEEMETSFASMQFAILLAVFMVYLVMASQFESLLHPFVILFSVPFSLVGVVFALKLFSVTVSVVVLIGVIMLAGIVVNNAILLLDTTNRLRRSGMAKLDALRQAGKVRLRPILMTTSTTVLGLFPMAIGLGEGSELRTPMAIAVIGGLILSTALTLLVIPAVYRVIGR